MIRHMNKLQISLDELSTLIDINVENLKEMYPALERCFARPTYLLICSAIPWVKRIQAFFVIFSFSILMSILISPFFIFVMFIAGKHDKIIPFFATPGFTPWNFLNALVNDSLLSNLYLIAISNMLQLFWVKSSAA